MERELLKLIEESTKLHKTEWDAYLAELRVLDKITELTKVGR